MSEQLGFFFPEPKPKVVAPAKPKDSAGHLRKIADAKEPLIFVYGQNPHLCSIRTHSSDDNGEQWPIMRKDIERILLKRGYYHHSNYISHRLVGQTGRYEKAKVYRFDKGLLKKIKDKEKSSVR
jgi:hypothetical protein